MELRELRGLRERRKLRRSTAEETELKRLWSSAAEELASRRAAGLRVQPLCEIMEPRRIWGH